MRNLGSHIKIGTLTGVCENRVLRRIFGPRRDEIIGSWEKVA
jgi:hypothetical protein